MPGKTSSNKRSQSDKIWQWGVLILVLILMIVRFAWSQKSALQSEEVTAQVQQSPAAEIAGLPTNVPALPQPSPMATSVLRPTTSAAPWANPPGDFDYYILALSWQPAFCEFEPGKKECSTQSDERFDAQNFVLHGLWPDQRNSGSEYSSSYCGLPAKIIQQDQSGSWCSLPDLALSTEVQEQLTTYMPGTASCLQNHEWYKHGVCTELSADAYYALANRLVELFAETEFNATIAAHTGDEMSRRGLLDLFEAEFGAGTSSFLSLRCDERTTGLLTEIRLAIRKDLGELNDLSQVFPDEKVQPQGNCPQKISIDAVGR